MTDQNPLQAALSRAKELQLESDGSMKAQMAEIVQLLNEAIEPSEGDAGVLTEDTLPEVKEVIGMYSQFISVMVHELRKPMTSIRGYADMLSKNVVGELNDMQMQFAQTIRNNVISMEGLIADISDLTKMRVGRIKPEPKMDLAKNLIMEIEKNTKEMAAAKDHTLVFEVPDGLPMLNIDGTRVKQALTKLVENALKYTPEGGKITVTASGEGDKLRIQVVDNGVGMADEEIARLGELWFRGDDPIVTNQKGYGLGIPITVECMRLVEGEFFYESKKGEGSTFGIVLPAMSMGG
jgi:signal transduction histidine kinase